MLAADGRPFLAAYTLLGKAHGGAKPRGAPTLPVRGHRGWEGRDFRERKGEAMKVIRAEVLGMCFGVRDALQALAGVAEPERVTIHGELVHNDVVLTQLGARGFR